MEKRRGPSQVVATRRSVDLERMYFSIWGSILIALVDMAKWMLS
jgi:hypothetical protein